MAQLLVVRQAVKDRLLVDRVGGRMTRAQGRDQDVMSDRYEADATNLVEWKHLGRRDQVRQQDQDGGIRVDCGQHIFGKLAGVMIRELTVGDQRSDQGEGEWRAEVVSAQAQRPARRQQMGQ